MLGDVPDEKPEPFGVACRLVSLVRPEVRIPFGQRHPVCGTVVKPFHCEVALVDQCFVSLGRGSQCFIGKCARVVLFQRAGMQE